VSLSEFVIELLGVGQLVRECQNVASPLINVYLAAIEGERQFVVVGFERGRRTPSR
jgi:hypothetical protein